MSSGLILEPVNSNIGCVFIANFWVHLKTFNSYPVYSQLTCNCSKSIIQSFHIFCKSRANSLQCNKAEGPTKTNSQNLNKQNLSFDAKLMYSCKLIKIHFSFTKINTRKNFESLAKINPRQNLSVQGKTCTSASVAWLIRTCLHCRYHTVTTNEDKRK